MTVFFGFIKNKQGKHIPGSEMNLLSLRKTGKKEITLEKSIIGYFCKSMSEKVHN